MPAEAVAAAPAAGQKESEASKRARRRQAQKANKKQLKDADAAQAAKFAALKSEKQEGGDADAAAEGEERKEGATQRSDADDAHVKREDGATAAAASAPSEFVVESPVVDLSNPAMAEFAHIFERFNQLSARAAGVEGEEEVSGAGADADDSHVKSKDERIDDELREQSGESESAELSRRKQKQRDRLAISDLKQLVAKPEVVELHDANAADPKLLVYLKSYRGTVPVPAHWSQKRKYLQNKRGFEKPPFQLPACIENTGITKMRGAQQEKEKDQTNKQKQRAKMQPKMGKIDIDYQILHDAFFRYQTKPPLTGHGELYFEGREHEMKMTDKRPCIYSPALREALGMTEETSPPPWLIAMQRYGPPPAYPNLKIPGVSAPIPLGARYGFGVGEWGKPPVDVNGRPLYGDVFGIEARGREEEKIDTTLWGQMESEGEEEEEEEEEEQDEAEQAQDDEGKAEDMDMEGGTASVQTGVSGLTTPETLNLRKADGTGTETPDTVRGRPSQPQALYQVLEEKKISVGGAMFGTQHTYTMPSSQGAAATDQEKRVEALRARQRGQVDVALNPDELEGLDAASLKRKYDARIGEQTAQGKASLVADDDDDDDDEGGKKKKRRKAGAGAEAKNKAYKDFKF